MKMSASGNREKAQSLLKMASIKHPPVDLTKIAKLLEFLIIPYPFPDKRKGMVFIEGGIKAIGINESHPVTLQRYTIGHEFGHFVNGHQHEDNAFIEDELKYFNHHYQQEREADVFASELLMPKNFLENDLAINGLDIEKLKDLYQVSEQALWIRLKTLRLAEKYAK
jgi:Zn-dependent peptidase ImmA (M78 family)